MNAEIAQRKQSTAGLERHRGVGLIEVLIAILLLSLGILVTASMVTNAIRTSNSAHFRTVATDIAMELTERMRANLPGLDDGDGDSTDGGSYITAGTSSQGYIDSTSFDCTTTPGAWCAMLAGAGTLVTCTPAQMAAFDIWSAARQIACINTNSPTLPNGDFRVRCANQVISGTTTTCAARRVTVTWQGNDDSSQQQISMLFLPGTIIAR